MMLKVLIGLSVTVLFSWRSVYSVHSSNSSSIKLAIVIFRHGERSPSGLYPTDPHRSVIWPGGFGALSQKGAFQGYQLGMKVRKRYEKLLPSTGLYATDDMYVRSSATERCLMTAQSFLAGLLPPNSEHHKLPIAWQPVAINSIPADSDKLISQRAICPKYDEMLKHIYSNPTGEMKQFIDQNADLFAYISEHSGQNVSLRGEQLYDILSIEDANGLELPAWTRKVYPEPLRELAARTMALLTENEFMKRVKGGYLITDVLSKMMAKTKNQLTPDRNLFIYSGHDTTLVNVMRAMNITAQTTDKPDFAASLHFELYHNTSMEQQFEVKMFYSHNAQGELKTIEIPKCPSPCALNPFNKAVENMIIRNYNKTCAIGNLD